MHLVCALKKKGCEISKTMKWFSRFYNEEINLKVDTYGKTCIHYLFDIHHGDSKFQISNELEEKVKANREILEYILEKFTQKQADNLSYRYILQILINYFIYFIYFITLSEI